MHIPSANAARLKLNAKTTLSDKRTPSEGRTMTCAEGRESGGLAMESCSRVLGDVRRPSLK